MRKYLFHRLLISIPTLLIISWVVFYISRSSPGDPVLRVLNQQTGSYDVLQNESDYRKVQSELGLDKPLFYISLSTCGHSKKLIGIHHPELRSQANRWMYHTGQSELVMNWCYEVSALRKSAFEYRKSSESKHLHNLISRIPAAKSPADASGYLQELSLNQYNQKINSQISAAQKALNDLILAGPSPARFLPRIFIHGLDNQYHHWISNFIFLDFGKSWADGRPVGEQILNALSWTMTLTIPSMFFIFGVGIFWGLVSTHYSNTWPVKILEQIFYALYSIPGYLLALFLLLIFGGVGMLDVFPLGGTGWQFHHSAFENIMALIHHMTLPVICLSLASVFALSRYLKASLANESGKEYLVTAEAKGLSEWKVLYYHSFRNALLPVVTMMGSIPPFLFGGSVLIETIFNLPGMGNLMYEAFMNRDYPIIMQVLMIGSLLTVGGILISDLLYAWLEPKIRKSFE